MTMTWVFLNRLNADDAENFDIYSGINRMIEVLVPIKVKIEKIIKLALMMARMPNMVAP